VTKARDILRTTGAAEIGLHAGQPSHQAAGV
jgi:hypothetical protein